MYIFCSSRRRHTSWPRDWSSDVCSSDLVVALMVAIAGHDDGDVVGGGGVSEDLHDACSARGVAGEEAVAIGLEIGRASGRGGVGGRGERGASEHETVAV